MSEPMSNHEIEDVLSSIRRLVSEDLRPAPRSSDDAGAGAREVSEKLILTPALRVVAEEGAQAVGAAEAGPAPMLLPVEERVARLGAAVTEEDEWESPFGDPEVWPGTLPADAVPSFVSHERRGASMPALEHGAVDLSDEGMQAPMAEFADMEELMEAAPDEDAAWRAPVREVSPPQDDAGWADEAEAAVRADLAKETEDEVISGLYGAQAGGMVFDEEVLRDLVRDLIREELSGSLGERITRNVRKLVRAEIARAVALREFE